MPRLVLGNAKHNGRTGQWTLPVPCRTAAKSLQAAKKERRATGTLGSTAARGQLANGEN